MNFILTQKLCFYIITFILFLSKIIFSKSNERLLDNEKSINYLKLPFEIFNIPKSEFDLITPELLIKKLARIRIKTNITIGSDKQMIPADISFEHYLLYVSGNKCKEKDLITFNQDKSTTFIDLNKINNYNFDQVCLKCNISKDNFYFNDDNKEIQLSFILGSLLKEEYKEVSAEIGLKPTKGKNEASINNFLTQLKLKKIISNRNFILHFLDKNNFNGEFVLGGYTGKYFHNNNNLKYFYISSENGKIDDWEFLLENAYYGKKYISQNNKVIISLKDLFIHTPYYMKKILENSFFEEYVNKSLCTLYNLEKSSSNFYVCKDSININKMNNFTFYPQNFNDPVEITFTPKDLFFKFDGNKYLFLMDVNTYYDNWIFGLPFIFKYQPIFDIDNKLISINTNNNINFNDTNNNDINLDKNKKNKNFTVKIFLTILIIFLLLIFIVLFKVFLKFIRKEKSKEKKGEKYLEFRDMSYYNKDSPTNENN